ncbi:MAG: FAD-binding protein, partial [Gaiellaceae bacterium]
ADLSTITVAGAGMAGLCAAARARELGLDTVVLEKGDRPGGSMLLSSCVVWRYESFGEFRLQCPDGDESLQRLVWERLDDALDWLEALGGPVTERETANPLTVGRRFDPRALTEALVLAAGEVRLGETTPDGAQPLVLATGGFQGSPELVAEHIAPAAPLPLRANPWSAGDGLRAGLARGGSLSAGMDEFYGRNMPDAAFEEDDFVPAAQLYAARARVVNDLGEEFLSVPVDWSETAVVQAAARQPGAAAWYLLDDEGAREVEPRLEQARRLGGTVLAAEELPFAAPEGIELGVRVRAAITHTIGGLQIDERARVVGADGLYAAGADAGGISAGGYASGLASALVLGLTAAEDAVS